MRTVPELVEAAVHHSGDRPAVRSPGWDLSYRQLFDAARRFGASLVGRGLAPGDRVSIWSFNSPEWIISYLGLLMAGAIAVPINTRFKAAEAVDILNRSRARMLITTRDFLGVDYVQMLEGSELPHLEWMVAMGGRRTERAESWEDLIGGGPPGDSEDLGEVDRRRAALGPDSPADIIFTSGTTGRPKGVVMSHRGTLRVGTDWVGMTGLRAEDRYLMVNPYFHMFGMKAGILACVAAGATMLPEPTLDVERLLERVEREGVTALPGPPTLFQAVLDHPARDHHDLTSLRLAVTGAADIPVELVRRIHEELPFSTVISAYGLTEGGTVSGTAPGDPFEAIATTVGRPRPGSEVRIADRGGNEVEPGQPGEIWLRGPSVMTGYLDDPEATKAAITPDGWLCTGDLGRFDRSGRLQIVGRLKDMFIVGGFNVYPAEVENLLLRHPGIGQAAVLGIPDERMGEVGVAFVVLRAGSRATPEEIIAWSRDQMANYKVPRRVAVVEDLPVNATGKVQKDVLRSLATATSGAGSPGPVARRRTR